LAKKINDYVAVCNIDEGQAPSQSRALDRRSGISPAEFKSRYLVPRKPVILEDAVPDWPALDLWDLEYFRLLQSGKLQDVGYLEGLAVCGGQGLTTSLVRPRVQAPGWTDVPRVATVSP
jgi:hypothetical protein